MNIVFIGFASCGKSATALEVSRRLERRFIDIDREIEARYKRQHSRALRYREIIKREGMQFFFDMEHAILADLKKADDCIIAPGGGAPMREENRVLLKELGRIIYLRTDPDVLLKRMKNKGLPLFLRDDPSIDNLQRLWNERHAVYSRLADITIDNTHYTITTTADCAMAALSQNGLVSPEHDSA
jgi:shikimate kinase